MRGVNATMSAGLSIVTSLGNEFKKITKQIISWGTIIGGITALMGLGGGLWGIERLAASIMAKRRMVLGLGGDYGRTQASMIFSQGLIGSPEGVLRNIALGMAGDPDKLTGLLKMGVNPFGKDAGQDPDKLMDRIVAKIPDIVNRAGPGLRLQMAHAYGLDQFLEPMDILRLATKEGQEEYNMKKKLVEQYKDQMKITPRALRAWTELELQLQAAGAAMKSAFGNALADLAGPLRHLSEGFTQFARALMDTPAMKEIIASLASGIEWLADTLKGMTKKDINDFIESLRSNLPKMEDFKSALKSFVELLEAANKVLQWLKPVASALGLTGDSPVGGAATAAGSGAVHDWLKNHLTPFGKDFFRFDSGRKDAAPSTTAPTAQSPSTAPSIPLVADPFSGARSSGYGLGETNAPAFNSFGGSTLQPSSGMVGTGWAQTIPGNTPRGETWSGAAGNMSPWHGIDQFTGTGSKGAQPVPGKGASLGPLSIDNWQSSRVANLIIRNVPGSNIFATAQGMTG